MILNYRMTRSFAQAFIVCAAWACAPSLPEPVPPGAVTSAADQSTPVRPRMQIRVPDLLIVGDTVLARVESIQCHRDLCSIELMPFMDSAAWMVDSDIAWITPEGLFAARAPGDVRLSLALPDTLLSARVRFIPPVTRLDWEPVVQRVTVGDTIFVRAVARDSAGNATAVFHAMVESGPASAVFH